MTAQLAWKTTAQQNCLTANGALGTYTIRALPSGQHLLQGTDDAADKLAWLGEVFNSAMDARNRATEIEDER